MTFHILVLDRREYLARKTHQFNFYLSYLSIAAQMDPEETEVAPTVVVDLEEMEVVPTMAMDLEEMEVAPTTAMDPEDQAVTAPLTVVVAGTFLGTVLGILFLPGNKQPLTTTSLNIP